MNSLFDSVARAVAATTAVMAPALMRSEPKGFSPGRGGGGEEGSSWLPAAAGEALAGSGCCKARLGCMRMRWSGRCPCNRDERDRWEQGPKLLRRGRCAIIVISICMRVSRIGPFQREILDHKIQVRGLSQPVTARLSPPPPPAACCPSGTRWQPRASGGRPAHCRPRRGLARAGTPAREEGGGWA
jgi:hypothetical protein